MKTTTEKPASPPGRVQPAVRHVASFSGGKDSTAMVLRLIEEDWPLDEIVFFDWGVEFPEMYDHIDKVENYIGRKITRLNPRRSFIDEMLNRNPLESSKRTWTGWPSPFIRWCTSIKADAMIRYSGESMQYIGIALDEAARRNSHYLKKEQNLFPLIKWKMNESDCLAYCQNRGFTWGGLYDVFPRVSCYCCPLQRITDLRNLRQHYPDLWQQMLSMDTELGKPNRGFEHYNTVHDLERRFAAEDRQMSLDFVKASES